MNMKKYYSVLSVWFLIASIIFAFYAVATRVPPVPIPVSDDKKQMFIMDLCQKSIKQILKAPASAVFPEAWDRGNSFMRVKDRWMVTTFVDAQNSFGAMIRSNYGCVFEENPPANFTLLKMRPIQ